MTPCSPRHRVHCSPAHAQLVDSYRDAVYAREALRESDVPVPAAFAFGAAVVYAQLEDDDFRAAVPPVLFKDWLIGHAGANRDPDE